MNYDGTGDVDHDLETNVQLASEHCNAFELPELAKKAFGRITLCSDGTVDIESLRPKAVLRNDDPGTVFVQFSHDRAVYGSAGVSLHVQL